MAREPDPSIERHQREQRLGAELLWDALRPEQEGAQPQPDADDVLPDFAESVVLCATHTIGRWKIVGHFAYDLHSVPAHTLIEHREPEALRALLRARGFGLVSGQLIEQHHTGVEIWKLPEQTEGAL